MSKCTDDGGVCGLGGFCQDCPQLRDLEHNPNTEESEPMNAPTNTDIATALANCNWSGVSLGNKVIILQAIDALAPAIAEVAEARDGVLHAQASLEEFVSNIPALDVWVGPMPESNGKSNFTAILMRKGASLFDDGMTFTIARSEYPDRVRYEADRVRYLIGQLETEPFVLDYDSDQHSPYVYPDSPAVAALRKLVQFADEAAPNLGKMFGIDIANLNEGLMEARKVLKGTKQ